MDFLISIVLLIIGILIVIYTLGSAIATFVVPRGIQSSLTRTVFRQMRKVFGIALKIQHAQTYEQRDRIMAFYAPVTLLVLPGIWVLMVCLGFTFIYSALGVQPFETAFKLSGSSLLTLGFSTSETVGVELLIFVEATLGLMLIALLIAYLPTMYSAFSSRESAVALLEVRAGSPPSASEMIQRYFRLRKLDHVGDFWTSWELWFTQVAETHTSLGALAFFRSPRPQHSWITAAGAVLDTAALWTSTLDVPRDVRIDTCIRAGYLCLRHICDFILIPYNPSPRPDDRISITRQEYDELYDQLQAAGVPMKPDRDQAWRDYSGWRVNYDTTLLALAAITMAPYAPWSSDRSFLPTMARKPKHFQELMIANGKRDTGVHAVSGGQ